MQAVENSIDRLSLFGALRSLAMQFLMNYVDASSILGANRKAARGDEEAMNGHSFDFACLISVWYACLVVLAKRKAKM